MANTISNDDLEQIRAALRRGDKVEAIKLHRAASGAGLAEAKQAVESLESSSSIGRPDFGSASNDDIDHIQAAVVAGRKIDAIRQYRKLSGEGLKEAKEFIEALEKELRKTEPGKFTAPAAKGCGMSVLCFVVVAVLIASVFWA